MTMWRAVSPRSPPSRRVTRTTPGPSRRAEPRIGSAPIVPVALLVAGVARVVGALAADHPVAELDRPGPGEVAAAWWTAAAWRSAFDGMHAQNAQEPPKRSRSTMATLCPVSLASSRAASPAAPAPMMTKSKARRSRGRVGHRAVPSGSRSSAAREGRHDLVAAEDEDDVRDAHASGWAASHDRIAVRATAGGLLERVAVDAAADGRERDAACALGLREVQRGPIGRREQVAPRRRRPPRQTGPTAWMTIRAGRSPAPVTTAEPVGQPRPP